MAGYGWKYKLIGPVEVGEVLDMPAPGASNPDCDLATATAAVGGTELKEGEFSVAIGTAVEDVDWIGLTNSTEIEWPEGAEAYVGVAGPQLSDARDMLLDHETRIAALEAAGAPASSSRRKKSNDDV
jgi:hypothetical protein